MGAVMLARQIDPLIRVAAINKELLKFSEETELVTLLEEIGHGIEGDGAFVVNAEGVIMASWDSKERLRSGKYIQFRPYFQMAMQGVESVYAAVGSSTGVTGIECR